MVAHAAGARWTSWVDAYRTDFATRGITKEDVEFDAADHVQADEQVRLLHGSLSGGESLVLQAVEAELMSWSSSTALIYESSPALPRVSGGSENDSDDEHKDCTQDGRVSGLFGQGDEEKADPSDPSVPAVPRLTVPQLVEHGRLWSFCPVGCSDRLADAARPFWQRYTYARANRDWEGRGVALDAILKWPELCLTRSRGGLKKTTKRINARLSYIAGYARVLADCGLPIPFQASQHYASHDPDVSAEAVWARRVRATRELAKRKLYAKGLQQLLGHGMADMSLEVVRSLEATFTHTTAPMPRVPQSAPPVLVDKDKLSSFIKSMITGAKGGFSGYSLEVIHSLCKDPVCLTGIHGLVEDIANNDLDPWSSWLMRTTQLAAANKKDPTATKRTLLMGENFLKIAASYVKASVVDSLLPLFAPIQVAVGMRGGIECALQAVQSKVETDPINVGVLHFDQKDAFPRISRAAVLSAAYAEEKLAPIWKVVDFSLGTPSSIVSVDHGKVVSSALSDNGVEIGHSLSSLLFCQAYQQTYVEASDGLDVVARAATDDYTAAGPYMDLFEVFDRLVLRVARLGGAPNMAKCRLQIPLGEATDAIRLEAASRGLQLVHGNYPALGGMIGVDAKQLDQFVSDKVAAYAPIVRAVSDPLLPAALSMYYARVHVQPMPLSLMRTVPIQHTMPHMLSFAAQLKAAVLSRLDTPPLNDTASFLTCQPISLGGCGFADCEVLVPAARWAGMAIAAKETQHLVDGNVDCALIRERVYVFNTLVTAGAPVTAMQDVDCGVDSDRWKTLPPNPAFLVSHYRDANYQSVRLLQKLVCRALQVAKSVGFLRDASADDWTRMASCKLKGASYWITNVNAAMAMSDAEFSLAFNLRNGQPPSASPLPSLCPLCGACMATDAYHFFSCSSLKRRSHNRKHDAVQTDLARFARANACLVHITPKQADGKVPDLEISLARGLIDVDVSGTHPLCPSIRSLVVGLPGKAVHIREAAKCGKYKDACEAAGKKFLAFGVESFGGFGVMATEVMQMVADEGFSVGASPYRQSLGDFRAALSVSWQRHNASTFAEWRRLCHHKAAHPAP